MNDNDGDGVCDEFEVFGCTDVSACNYSEGATDDDGSCSYDCQGCTIEGACNFDPMPPSTMALVISLLAWHLVALNLSLQLRSRCCAE